MLAEHGKQPSSSLTLALQDQGVAALSPSSSSVQTSRQNVRQVCSTFHSSSAGGWAVWPLALLRLLLCTYGRTHVTHAAVVSTHMLHLDSSCKVV